MKKNHKEALKKAVHALEPIYGKQNLSLAPKVHSICTKSEEVIQSNLLAFMKKANQRFNKGLDLDKITPSVKFTKEESSDDDENDNPDEEVPKEIIDNSTEEAILRYLRLRFALALSGGDANDNVADDIPVDVSDEVLPAIQKMMPALSDAFSDVHNFKVGTNWNQPNSRAVKYMANRLDNTFSNMPDDLAQGFYNAISREMDSTEGGNTVANIAKKIASGVLSNDLTFPTMTIKTKTWANLVAVTESRRAATESQRQLAQELDLKTYKFTTNGHPCPECEPYEDQVYTWGDGPESPIHVSCQCVCYALNQEISAKQLPSE